MTCSKMERLVSAFVDRELTAEEQMRVRRHIIECSECASSYSAFREIKGALENLPEPPPVPGLLNSALLDAGQVEPSRFSFREMWSFTRLVVPAALAGTLVALPLVQLMFGTGVAGSLASKNRVAVESKAPSRQTVTAPLTRASVSHGLSLALEDPHEAMRLESFLRQMNSSRISEGMPWRPDLMPVWSRPR